MCETIIKCGIVGTNCYSRCPWQQTLSSACRLYCIYKVSVLYLSLAHSSWSVVYIRTGLWPGNRSFTLCMPYSEHSSYFVPSMLLMIIIFVLSTGCLNYRNCKKFFKNFYTFLQTCLYLDKQGETIKNAQFSLSFFLFLVLQHKCINVLRLRSIELTKCHITCHVPILHWLYTF